MQEPGRIDPAAEPSQLHLNCPHCATPLEASPTETPQVINCPECGRPFILPSRNGATLPTANLPDSSPADGFYVIDDELQPRQQEESREDELDALRIRRIADQRRAAYRSRFYCLIGALLCAAAAGQLLWNLYGWLRHSGWSVKTLAYTLGATACVYLAIRLYRQARQLGEE